jgi:hypothetical protein
MQDALGSFIIRGTITTVAATPKTAVQYQASSTNAAEILYFGVSQSGSTVSAMDELQIWRNSAGATVTIGLVGGLTGNIFDLSGGAATFRGTLSTSATGVNASAEGTHTDNVSQHNFNVLAGLERDLQPQARIWVPVSGIIAFTLKAVIAATYDVQVIIREMK